MWAGAWGLDPQDFLDDGPLQRSQTSPARWWTRCAKVVAWTRSQRDQEICFATPQRKSTSYGGASQSTLQAHGAS